MSKDNDSNEEENLHDGAPAVGATLPNDLRKGIAKAEEALAVGDLASAREICGKLAMENTRCGQALLGLCKVDYLEEKIQSAAENYKKALDCSPTLGAFLIMAHLSPSEKDRMLSFALALEKEGLPEESMKFAERLLEQDITEETRCRVQELRERLAPLIYADTEKKRDPTLERSGRMARICFYGAAVILIIGIIYAVILIHANFTKFNIRTGETHLERAAKLNEEFLNREQGADRVREELMKAYVIFSYMAKKDDNKALAHLYLSRTCQELARLAEKEDPGKFKDQILQYKKDAVRELELALKEDPDFPEALIGLARAKFQEKDFDGAKEYLEKAAHAISRMEGTLQARKESLRSQVDYLAAAIGEAIGKRDEEQRKSLSNPPPTPREQNSDS